MAVVNGVRYVTTNANASLHESGARLVVDMRNQIAQLQPDESPFITFLRASKKNTRVAYNPKFEWMEDDLVPNGSALAAAVESTSATSITVTTGDGAMFRVGDIIMVGAEAMLVTAISTDTLTVTRGFGGSTAATASSADPVYIISNAYAENSTSPAAVTTRPEEKYNYTQIFRTSVELSNTADKTKMYGGADRGYQRGKALLEHKREIAKAFYAGFRTIDATYTKRTTGGLFSFLTQTQAFAAAGTALTYANFDELVAQKVFRYGSKEKLLIAGPKLSTCINMWSLNKVVTDVSTEAAYGMRVKKLNTSYGDLMVVYDPLLADLGHPDYGIILDTNNINYVHLDGRDTKLYTNVQENDRDGIKDEYLTECGLEVRLPKTHMLITGAYVPA